MIHRISKIEIPLFVRVLQSKCPYGKATDSKSEWHIRMQYYFLIGAQEVRFADEKNGQIHIADVFPKDTNTVIEFQHSPIAPDEFCSRTAFHLHNGRRNTLVKIAKNLAVSRSALYRLVHEYEEKHGRRDF